MEMAKGQGLRRGTSKRVMERASAYEGSRAACWVVMSISQHMREDIEETWAGDRAICGVVPGVCACDSGTFPPHSRVADHDPAVAHLFTNPDRRNASPRQSSDKSSEIQNIVHCSHYSPVPYLYKPQDGVAADLTRRRQKDYLNFPMPSKYSKLQVVNPK